MYTEVAKQRRRPARSRLLLEHLEPRALLTAAPVPDGLVSWWPGDGHAADIWGNNDGTLMNGATYAPGLVGQATTSPGLMPEAPALVSGEHARLVLKIPPATKRAIKSKAAAEGIRRLQDQRWWYRRMISGLTVRPFRLPLSWSSRTIALFCLRECRRRT